MSRNYVTEGDHFNYTPSADVASGAVVLMTDTIGIVNNAILANTMGVVAVDGVFILAKASADTLTQGQKIYWNNTNKNITSTSAGNTLAGRVYEAAGAGVTTVKVLINK